MKKAKTTDEIHREYEDLDVESADNEASISQPNQGITSVVLLYLDALIDLKFTEALNSIPGSWRRSPPTF